MLDPVVNWIVSALARAWPLSQLSILAFVALALVLSIHVTFNKRDPRSAIGWIGLIWLSPVLGSILYLMLGINRMFRVRVKLRRLRNRPSRAEGPLTSPAQTLLPGWEPVMRTGDEVTRRPCTEGNTCHLLDGGEVAYPRMLEAIRQAKHSVGLLTYIFDRDDTGKEFVQALAEAQARGVHVRVLIDGLGAALGFGKIPTELRRAKIPYAIFLPAHFPTSTLWMNLRNHRKLMTIDGLIAFTGGMNITEACRLDRKPARPVLDAHFEVHGKVVRELQKTFSDDWFFATKEVLDGPEWFPDPLEAKTPGVPARPVVDGPDQHRSTLPWVLMAALAQAEKHVTVITPYFVPDRAVQAALGCAALRGIRVDILVPRISDNRVVDWAARRHLRYLARQGARVWETPAPFCHSKITLIDDQWYCIGSSNWDTRSFRLNFELNVEFYDPVGAKSVRAYVEKVRDTSTEISGDLRGPERFFTRLREGIAWLGSPYL